MSDEREVWTAVRALLDSLPKDTLPEPAAVAVREAVEALILLEEEEPER